jgi:Ca2+-transporting ATPase
LTGNDLDRLSPEELKAQVEQVSIFARVAPEHKLKIVDALQEQGHVVAMTGDGVNDAPALKSADIGVAMGITGTDVSKEAAEMVLQDDNFATILAAVEEGRIIMGNVLRFVRYILASNSAEILAMLAAPFFGLPLPLLPVQILWMNLVTDGLPALALGFEKGEPNIMSQPPRNPKSRIIDGRMGVHILWVGVLMAALAVGIGVFRFRDPGSAQVWQTMLFTTLVFSQLTLALAERSLSSVFTIGLFSNRYMVWALSLTLLLQLAAVYVPFLQPFFHTRALSPSQLGTCALLSLTVFAAVEIEKTLARIIRQR